MSDWDPDGSLTMLNTALNKSMVLMDSSSNSATKTKCGKSIKISTKTQSPNSSVLNADMIGKSILKKSSFPETNTHEETQAITTNSDIIQNTQPISNSTARPQNLEDILNENTAIMNPIHSTFNLEDISDSEDLWVMDIPKTVNPRNLTGQTLLLGGKSKLKIGRERYCAVNRNNECCLTCVFSTGRDTKSFKAVNIKPAGVVNVRRKLPGVSKRASELSKVTAVPFPRNIKIRDPFFGSTSDEERIIHRRKTAKKERTS